MYQDIPLYPLEEYVTSAPPDLRTEDIMSDEHQLMLSRLNFELSERQKYGTTFLVACHILT
jgi:THO complex subunit 5